MFRLTTICLVALSTMFVGHIAARGRSFPIEVMGTILQFNRPNQTFTIRVAKTGRILSIAVGRDCKFKQHGAPVGEQILKAGARVKVSYFATIFTGNIAVEIELNPVSSAAQSVSGGKISESAPTHFRRRAKSS